MIHSLVFDFDGTIFDSMGVLIQTINNIADKYKFKKINIKETDEFRKLGTEKMIKMLEIPRESIKEIMDEIKDGLSNSIEVIEPVTGITEVMNILKRRGYNMFIVTSNNKANVDSLLNKFAINSFNGIYSDASLYGKEQLLAKLIQEQNIEYKNVVYIGDETRDIKAGKACGCKTMAVTWGLNGIDALRVEGADWVVNEPGEILNIFR